MKTKKLFLMAAMLLMSVCTYAQSETPLKGDVNGDGKVDVADIVAVIKIMKNNGGTTEKVYYWYIGATNPSTISSTLVTETNKEGWHIIGTSLSGFNLVFNNQNKIEFDEKTQYYLIIPDDLHVYAADGNTNVDSLYFNSVECNIENHKAFQYTASVWEVKGLVIK